MTVFGIKASRYAPPHMDTQKRLKFEFQLRDSTIPKTYRIASVCRYYEVSGGKRGHEPMYEAQLGICEHFRMTPLSIFLHRSVNFRLIHSPWRIPKNEHRAITMWVMLYPSTIHINDCTVSQATDSFHVVGTNDSVGPGLYNGQTDCLAWGANHRGPTLC